jgi:hypothetical protein
MFMGVSAVIGPAVRYPTKRRPANRSRIRPLPGRTFPLGRDNEVRSARHANGAYPEAQVYRILHLDRPAQ